MEPNTQGVAGWQWVVSAIVVIGLIVLGVYFFTGDDKSKMMDDTNSPALNVSGQNRLIVADQSPGNIVYITTVQLAQPGFVNITKDVAGKPGVVIGTQTFEKGITTGKVNLTETTVSGNSYHAVLYYTDAKDAVLVDRIFRVSDSLPEDKG